MQLAGSLTLVIGPRINPYDFRCETVWKIARGLLDCAHGWWSQCPQIALLGLSLPACRAQLGSDPIFQTASLGTSVNCPSLKMHRPPLDGLSKLSHGPLYGAKLGLDLPR